jgi:tetratricopeptide (TPR) repeat protein
MRGGKTQQARNHLDLADSELKDSDSPAFRISSHRLRAAAWAADGRDDLANTQYQEALAVQPSGLEKPKDLEHINEHHCFARAELVINAVRADRLADLPAHVESIESFVRTNPLAQDGQVLLQVTDALITYYSRRQDGEGAGRALAMIREACTTKDLAYQAATLLQNLTGRSMHLDATDIAIACANLSAELSERAERPDFYWVAQANLAGVYLSSGQTEKARRQIELLDPVLRNDQTDPQLKAGIMSMAAALLAQAGAPEQAIAIMQKAQQQVRAEPQVIAETEFQRGRYLVDAGRTEEALAAFNNADRLARETKAPGQALFDINVQMMKAATELGRWTEAEAALAALQILPPARHYVSNVLEILRQELDGTREIKRRLQEIHALPTTSGTGSLAAANAEAFKPLVTWWHEYLAHGTSSERKSRSDKDNQFGALGVLYDYWGGGSAAKIMANLRDHAPNHFTPFVEVRSLQEVRRAIRMLTLVSDCLVLLWKGSVEGGMAASIAPFDYVCGGAGYMAALASKAFDSKETGPWFFVTGHGAYLPISLIKLLTTEALPLLEQGRLIVLPAPAVGCAHDAFGSSEQLLADLMAATPLAQTSVLASSFPLGVLPYFENAPFGVLADLVAEDANAARRLRLALIRKTNELRVHGALEAVSREIADEIADALASLDGTHRGISRKRGFATGHDRLGATARSFQDSWAPVLTLRRLGYRMTIAKMNSQPDGKRERFVVKEGTPFGNWLNLPGQHVLVPAVRLEPSESGSD